MKVVSYCLDCLNRFVKFVSKNGYIMIALTSNNFCLAAWRAFTLIVSNAGRFMVAQTLGAIFNFLGKLFITLLTLATCIGFMFIPAVNNNISSLLFPSIMVCIIGFTVAAIFISMFSFSMDTMVLCFLVDEVLAGAGNPGKHRPEELDDFASKSAI